VFCFFFSSRRRHTRFSRDWSSDVCSSDLVYATVGSDERVRAVEALGAVLGINYRTQDYVQEVKNATGGKGVDVVLDMVAGDYIRSEERRVGKERRDRRAQYSSRK